MRIIIVGAGAVGTHLADRLSQENHDVTVIERNKERLRSIQDDLDILTIEGNGASPKLLSEAGIDDCDLLMAMTNSDETNLVACLSAAQFEVPFKIARVSNMDYYMLDNWLAEKNLAVDLLVNPEFQCALQISNLLMVPGATDVAEFGGGRAMMAGLEVQPKAPCIGDPLRIVRHGRRQGCRFDMVLAGWKSVDTDDGAVAASPRKGSSSSRAITALQTLLHWLGFDRQLKWEKFGADGDYGRSTTAAVAAFGKREVLGGDGRVLTIPLAERIVGKLGPFYGDSWHQPTHSPSQALGSLTIKSTKGRNNRQYLKVSDGVHQKQLARPQ